MATPPEPVKINNVNKTAILGVKAKMTEDPQMGKDAPVMIECVFDPKTGVVSAPDLPGDLKAAPVPGLAAETIEGIPSILSFCPIAVAGCYSLVFMMQAAEKDFQFTKFETFARADMDISHFYNPKVGADAPWDKVRLEIKVDGPQTQQELQQLADKAHDHCPSTELLEKPLKVSPPNVVNKLVETEDAKPVEDAKTLNGFNLEAYRVLAAKTEATKLHQQSHGVWFCQEWSPDYPGAFMTMQGTIHGPNGFKKHKVEDPPIPMAQEAPVGSGKYANPVQICLFGAVAFYLQTLALNLGLRGYAVTELKGKIGVKMNKRKVMGVETDTNIFDESTFTLDVNLECGAPDAVMAKVIEESNLKSPGLAGMANPIKLDYHISKVKISKGQCQIL